MKVLIRCSITAALLVVPLLRPPGSAGQESRAICLTFEKLPYMQPMGFWTPRETSNMIVRTLDQYHIQAMGFVVEEKIDDDPSSYVVLEDWISRGHLLGNNTYSYVDFNELSTKEFVEHIADGQKYLRKVTRASKTPFKFLRFPLLHEGNTPSKRKDIAKILYRNDYRVVPVTIKTSDYQFNHFYVDLQPGSPEMAKLKELYLAHLERSLSYSEAQSEEVFGHQIKHILELSCGIATAAFLGDTIELLKARGYTFLSVPDALTDPAYETADEYTSGLGLTFLDRIAAARGLSFDAESGEISRRDIRAAIGTGPSE